MAKQDERKAAENGKADQNKDAGNEAQPEQMQNLNYEMLLLGLSILSVINIAIYYFAWDPDIDTIIDIINVPLTVIFFIDFCIRIRGAESKSRYFFKEFGWADLAASLPFPQFKILRLFRILRASRMIRHYGAKNLMHQISDNRADAALAVIVFAIICVLEFGGMAMIYAERTDPNANIKTGSDAVWWGYVTITTVGYGDRYPVTNLGRVIGVVVLTTGVALFGVLTGYLANAFLSPSKKKSEEAKETPPAPQPMLDEINQILAEQEKSQEKLRSMVAQLKEGVQ
jgi:voltage-gated potassium channel